MAVAMINSVSQLADKTQATSLEEKAQAAQAARKANSPCMHKLLDHLIRGTGYLQEEDHSDDELFEKLKSQEGTRETTAPTPAALETEETPAKESGTLSTRKHLSDYFIQLHQNRAKEASEKGDWEEAEAELVLADKEHQRQMRRQYKLKGLRSFSRDLESTQSQSSSLLPIQTGEHGHNALRRMHSQIGSSTETKTLDGVNHLLLKGDEEDEELLARSTSRESNKSAKVIKLMTDEEKLLAIQTEFGKYKQVNDADDEEEKILASEPCVLYRRVLIRGYGILTNHRLCFVAYLPDEHSDVRQEQSSAKVIRQSPAILHRPGLTKRRKKAWFVLTHHSITAYHNSDDLYEPLGSIRLSDIGNVAPAKHHSRHSISFRMKDQTYYMEFESEEGASSWLKEIDLARWRLAHNVDKVRIALPLVRVVGTRSEPYLQAITLLHLDILVDNLYLQSGNHRLEYLQRLHREKENLKPQHTTEIVFGMKKGASEIENIIMNSLIRPTEWRNARSRHEWWSLPAPTLELEGPAAWQDERDHDHPDGLHDRRNVQKKIVDEFSLNCKLEDVRPVKTELVRTLPSMGIMALTPDYLCFYRRRRLTGLADTRIKVPIDHLKTAIPCKAFRWHHFGLRVQIQAHEDLHFEFHQAQFRDKAIELIQGAIEAVRVRRVEQTSFQPRKKNSLTPHGRALASQANQATITLPIHAISQVPRAVNTSSSNYRPIRIDPIKIICLTIGSRGDVQPYIALCKELQRQSHECIIVSHSEYEEWVRGYGIDFRPAGGDPGALMKLSVENKMYSPTFFREAISKFKHWLDELLRDIMTSCWDADLIIESPSTFGGIHVAEAIGCYYMRAFTMPWTKTSAYPQAFSVPSVDMGPQYNAMSYTMFDQLLWTASSGQINRWRKHMLNLEPTSMAKMHAETVPFMYNFSPAVVPPPLDWGSLTAVTGYWTLESKDDSKYEAPQDLVDFISKAKKEEKKLAYIGFGSITIADPRATQKAIYEAVQKSDVRAIVSKGWSDRMKEKEEGKEEEAAMVPEEVYTVDSIPHDWLFSQIHIAMHHGGAGTTGASLKAGLVTLIHPFFGDQYFWSGRVDKLGAGIRVKNLKVDTIAEALGRAKDDRIMKEKAEVVGEALRKENGVDNAINFIYLNLSKSKRIKRVRGERRRSTASADDGNSSAGPVTSASEDEGGDSDELEPREDRRYKELLANNQSHHISHSLLSYNGLKQASIHPIDALHLTRSRGTRGKESPRGFMSIEKQLGGNLEDDVKRDAPEEISVSPVQMASEINPTTFDNVEADDNGEKEEIPIDEERRRSLLFGLQYMPSLQHQFSFHYPNMSSIMKLGLGSHSTDATKDGLVNGNEMEVEVQKRREESKQKHRSAKKEDQRRRQELISAWKRAKRWDLIAEVVEEEGEEEEKMGGGNLEEEVED